MIWKFPETPTGKGDNCWIYKIGTIQPKIPEKLKAEGKENSSDKILDIPKNALLEISGLAGRLYGWVHFPSFNLRKFLGKVSRKSGNCWILESEPFKRKSGQKVKWKRNFPKFSGDSAKCCSIVPFRKWKPEESFPEVVQTTDPVFPRLLGLSPSLHVG